MKHILILLLFLSTLRPVAAQEGTFSHGVQVRTETAMSGYVLLAPIGGDEVYLIDYGGNLIHQWDLPNQALAVYLLENGNLLASLVLAGGAGATGRVIEVDWDGNIVWDYQNPDIHHNIHAMPNGNILMLAWERFPREEIFALGLNPDLLPTYDVAERQAAYDGLWLDTVIEVERESKEIIWRWAASEHLIQDFDPNAPNFGEISSHPRRINLNYSNVRLPSDRIHFNALDYNAERDEIIANSHYYSEVWILDHSLSSEEASTEAGDLLYRWGNPATYQRGTNRGLYLQHDAQWLPDNSILVFNNGMPILRAYSTIDLIIPPLDEFGNYRLDESAAFEPQEALRLYQAPNPRDFYAFAVSGVTMLPNHHLFITEGTKGRIFEVDSQGEVVWEYLNPIFLTANSDDRSYLFKAQHYFPDYPAFIGRDLAPRGILQLRFLDRPAN